MKLSSIIWKSVASILLLIFVFIGILAGTNIPAANAAEPASVQTPEQCSTANEAMDWLQKTQEGVMPSDLPALLEVPEQYRRALYSASSPEVKALLWQQHLETFLTEDAGLTDVQQTELKAAIARITPQVFSRQERAGFDPVDLRETFGPDLVERMFANLGPGVPAVNSGPKCRCSHIDDYCGDKKICKDLTPDGCSYTKDGCGTLFLVACTGLCQPK